MNILESKQIDQIEDVIKTVRKDAIYCSDAIELEIEATEQEVEKAKQKNKALHNKLYQLENIKKYGTAKVPKKFRKVEEIIKEEKNQKRFYYNLFFFGFVDFDFEFGYLLSNNTDFYLKFTTYADKFPEYPDFKEVLYVTESKAKEVLYYDVFVEEMEKQSLEASQ